MIRRDERGVTAPLEYVYTFAIAAILITGLVIAATNLAGSQQRRTVEAQMNVVAEQVAGSLEDADRIVQSTEGGVSELSVEHELPDELLGGHYFVTIDSISGSPASGPTATVTVSSHLANDDISTTVDLQATSIGSAQTVDGGEIVIEYIGGNLEVNDG